MQKVGKLTQSQLEMVADAPHPELALIEKEQLEVGDLLSAMEQLYRVPAVLLSATEIDPECASLISDERVLSQALPLRRHDDKLVVAMIDPSDVVLEDNLRFITGYPIERVAVLQFDLLRHRLGRGDISTERGLAEVKNLAELKSLDNMFEARSVEVEELMKADQETLDTKAHDAPPVVRAVNSILSEGVLQRASDIHLEPAESGLRVRFRIDGSLRDVIELPKMVTPMVLSRIKLASGMDISEKRRPQDGRTKIRVSDRDIDFRVSSLPTFFGEKIVLRILDRSRAQPTLEEMGFDPHDLEAFNDFIHIPQGMVLITGPTGSGKTSTLYAALRRIHEPHRNIITVEDPVEMQLQGINQVQVNVRAGLTFATALRSILRQDPDVVMLGEIRDSETATIALEAAMTGHLVLSTLHTNDAPTALPRLIHLGAPPYLVASSLTGVMAQRLVRRLCERCKQQTPPDPYALSVLARSDVRVKCEQWWDAAGCRQCNSAGYIGRMGIFEVLRMTESLRAAVFGGATENEVREIARAQGMHTLLEDGLLKCAQGLTSLREVMKVAPAGAEASEREPVAGGAFSVPPPAASAAEAAPAAAAAAPPLAPAPAAPPVGTPQAPVGGDRILVVDDDAGVRNFVREVLTKSFYQVEVANDGMSGLAAALANPPDLILVDYEMPDINGPKLCQKLRSHAATRGLPILFLTGMADLDHESAGLEAGADGYLVKPIAPQRLVLHVENALRRARSRGGTP
jgi:type IV pilus assembly protein PilB